MQRPDRLHRQLDAMGSVPGAIATGLTPLSDALRRDAPSFNNPDRQVGKRKQRDPKGRHEFMSVLRTSPIIPDP